MANTDADADADADGDKLDEGLPMPTPTLAENKTKNWPGRCCRRHQHQHRQGAKERKKI